MTGLHTIGFKIDGHVYQIECVSRIDGYPKDADGECAFCHGNIGSPGNTMMYFARTPLAHKCPMCENDKVKLKH